MTYDNYGFLSDGKNFAHKIQDCKIYSVFIEGFEEFERYGTTLENHYKCQGFCTPLQSFVFID